MTNAKVLILVLIIGLVSTSEVEENEQKKRGAGKTTLNAIPTTGSQKTEYTYSIYGQNLGGQPAPSNPPYQSQTTNSFYPTQSASQYYQPTTNDPSSLYPPQPQINLIPPPNSSPFVPINFLPNPGYQAKYQIIPTKGPNGNIQLLIQPSAQTPQYIPYPQNLFNPSSQIAQPNQIFNSYSPQGITPNYQLQSQPYTGQQPTMLIFAQPSPSAYPNNLNNIVYPNNANLFNYYQTPQSKYNVYYGSSQPPSSDYDRLQAGLPSVQKEDNEISAAQTSDYITQSDPSSTYKNSYISNRNSYKN